MIPDLQCIVRNDYTWIFYHTAPSTDLQHNSMMLYRVTGHSPSPPSVAWPTSALSGNTVQRSTPSTTLTLVISTAMLMTYNFCTVLGLKIDEIYSFEATSVPVFYLVTKIKEIAFYKTNT